MTEIINSVMDYRGRDPSARSPFVLVYVVRVKGPKDLDVGIQ